MTINVLVALSGTVAAVKVLAVVLCAAAPRRCPTKQECSKRLAPLFYPVLFCLMLCRVYGVRVCVCALGHSAVSRAVGHP